MSKNSGAACLVTTTIDSREGAERLAKAIVQAGLGACVQIQAVSSHYRWQGHILAENECRLDIKTLDSVFEPLCALIVREHPYETPEIIMVPVSAANPEYLAWLTESIKEPRL